MRSTAGLKPPLPWLCFSEKRSQLLGEVTLRVEDFGAERQRVSLAQCFVDGRRQAPRLRWQVD